MVAARGGIDEKVWQDARVELDTAGMDAGHPYRTRSLYCEASRPPNRHDARDAEPYR